MQASQVVVVAAALSVGFVLPALVSSHSSEATWSQSAAPAEVATPGPRQRAEPGFERAVYEIQLAIPADAARKDGAGAVVVTNDEGADMALITFEGQVLLPRE